MSPSLETRASLLLLVLRIALAGAFALMAVRNLSGDVGIAADFARWGYSNGFRQLTAWLQVVGALALLFPPTAFAGALLLLTVLLGAVATHLRYDPPASVIPAVLFLVVLVSVLVAYRPAAWR